MSQMKKQAPSVKTKTTEPTIIRMTKIKQWYVVADAEAYSVLAKAGTPMIRVHQNFLPTLGLMTDKHNIKIKGVDFESEIFEPFLTKTTETWGRKYGKVQVTSKVLVFTAQALKGCTDPLKDENLNSAKSAVDKLQPILTAFFARWGYRCTLQYSEAANGNKIKLHVEYWFDSEKMPVLPLETPVQELKEVCLKLGFARLVLKFDNHQKRDREIAYIHVRFEVSQGGSWVPVHTSKCLATQISDVQPMVQALMGVVNIDPHNQDNEA